MKRYQISESEKRKAEAILSNATWVVPGSRDEVLRLHTVFNCLIDGGAIPESQLASAKRIRLALKDALRLDEIPIAAQ